MDINDQRDYAEESANRYDMDREGYNEYLSELAESVTDHFDSYRTDPEYSVIVPAIDTSDNTRLEILISAVGGGEVGESYAQNYWIYGIKLNEHLIVSGHDLHSGMPATHQVMAETLAHFESDRPDSPALLPFTDKLSLFAHSEEM